MANPRPTSISPWQQFGVPPSPQLPDALGAVAGLGASPQQQYASSSPGPQPTWTDRIVASPLGRLTHDKAVQPIEAGAQLASKVMDVLVPAPVPLLQTGVDAAVQGVEGLYQGALARNRNTPGYAAARSAADQARDANGAMDFHRQALASLRPAAAGLNGLVRDGWDAANAQADSQTAAHDDYAQQNPGKAAAADLLGGLATGKATGLLKFPEIEASIANSVSNLLQKLKPPPAISHALTDTDQVLSHFNDGVDWLNKGRDAYTILGDGNEEPQSDPQAGAQQLMPPSSDSYTNFPGSQIGPLDSSGIAPGGPGPSLSDHFGMFGNPKLRPEIFGNDSGFTFSLPQSAPAPAGMGVQLQTPDYSQQGFTGTPAPATGVNLNPGFGGGASQPFDPDIFPIS